ncbi:MAG: hypothetical protein QOC59_1396, partial [Microbacteriaceae bacterium]|nr:hypothetical protein [Microbacteriaceae bacterium]
MADPDRSPQEPAAPSPAEDTEAGQAERVAPSERGTAPAEAPAPPATAVAAGRGAPGVSADRTPTETERTGTPATARRADEPIDEPVDEPVDDRTRPYQAEPDRADASGDRPTEVIAPAAPQASAPTRTAPPRPAAPPKEQNNRLAGTAWVLLASLVFEAVLIGGFALLVLIAAGPSAIGRNLAQFFTSPFAWLPVLLFFLFYELTVLLFNRAGRFLYVLASLVVGAIIYLLFATLFLALQPGGISNEQALGRVLI